MGLISSFFLYFKFHECSNGSMKFLFIGFIMQLDYHLPVLRHGFKVKIFVIRIFDLMRKYEYLFVCCLYR